MSNQRTRWCCIDRLSPHASSETDTIPPSVLQKLSFLFWRNISTPWDVSPVDPFTRPHSSTPLQQRRTHEFHQEPRPICRLAVSTRVHRGLLRHDVRSCQADRP